MKAKAITKALDEVPADPYGAFAWFVSQCASGLYRDLMKKGKTDKEARNAAIHCFLDFASGEACRIARREGREPDSSLRINKVKKPETGCLTSPPAFSRAPGQPSR